MSELRALAAAMLEESKAAMDRAEQKAAEGNTNLAQMESMAALLLARISNALNRVTPTEEKPE